MIALKELLELLAAGSQMIPLADNDEVYRRLEERLESLHADDHVERSPPKAASRPAVAAVAAIRHIAKP